jgi:hydrogenase maturation protease
MTDAVLVIGYGNSLRSDDGAGPLAASLLAHDIRSRRLRVLQCHQLTPELAVDLSSVSRAILIDAEVPAHGADQQPRGEGSRVTVRAIEPLATDANRISHHLDAASLLALTRELYGSSPRTWLVSVRGDSFEVGEDVSADVRAALPAVVEACLDIAEGGDRA